MESRFLSRIGGGQTLTGSTIGEMLFSPFYETEALHQGDKTDVFYVKITNNRNENIIFNVKKCKIIDQGENVYNGMDYEDLKERFLYMARATGLYVTNGLETARRILIEKRMQIVEKTGRDTSDRSASW